MDSGLQTKRKAQDAAEESEPQEENDDAANSDIEMIDIDFEFFNFTALDYHSIKLLLTQLMSKDAPMLDLGGIADLVLSQPSIGSTVKTDGEEGDPFAILSVLNLTQHQAVPCVASLIAYLLAQSVGNSNLHASLTSLLAQPASTPSKSSQPKHVGIVLSERMVNMPPQIAQPMYRMLKEELDAAKAQNLPYQFSHLLFVSRVFVASPDSFDDDPNAGMTLDDEESTGESGKKSKKKKKKGNGGGGSLGRPMAMEEQIWVYHPEDDYIEQSAVGSHVFNYSTKATHDTDSRAADSFGVETRGKIMLVEAKHLSKIVNGMEGFLSGAE